MEKKQTTKTPLPKGIKPHDLTFAKWEETKGVADYNDRTFELWHVASLGWCIPTLLIGKASGRQSTDRTYAVTLDGRCVRIGKGPHVTETVVVYVRTSRLSDLQRFLDIRRKGAADAGTVRDRISSRRAQGALERALGNSSWRWKV